MASRSGVAWLTLACRSYQSRTIQGSSNLNSSSATRARRTRSSRRHPFGRRLPAGSRWPSNSGRSPSRAASSCPKALDLRPQHLAGPTRSPPGRTWPRTAMTQRPIGAWPATPLPRRTGRDRTTAGSVRMRAPSRGDADRPMHEHVANRQVGMLPGRGQVTSLSATASRKLRNRTPASAD